MVDNIKLNRYLASYSFRHESDVTKAWNLENQCAWDNAEILD